MTPLALIWGEQEPKKEGFQQSAGFLPPLLLFSLGARSRRQYHHGQGRWPLLSHASLRKPSQTQPRLRSISFLGVFIKINK